MPKKRWAHYTNICQRCDGEAWLYNSSRHTLVQCPDCEGTGYGSTPPPYDGSRGSANAVVTTK